MTVTLIHKEALSVICLRFTYMEHSDYVRDLMGLRM